MNTGLIFAVTNKKNKRWYGTMKKLKNAYTYSIRYIWQVIAIYHTVLGQLPGLVSNDVGSKSQRAASFPKY